MPKIKAIFTYNCEQQFQRKYKMKSALPMFPG